MAIPKSTKNYLDKKMAKYDELTHKTVYTAYDAAQTLRRELREIAKSLLVATDKAYVIAVLPAHMRIDMVKLKKSLRARKVSIPNEKVMVKVFKVKPGSMTAFGGLHKIEVVVDKSLLKVKDVILSAGSFTDSVRMKTKDFIDLEQAKLVNFAKAGGYKLTAKSKAKPKKKKALAKNKPLIKKNVKKPVRKVVKKTAKSKAAKKTVKMKKSNTKKLKQKK
ncbi:MAG: YbaK/EbsC family protein [Patescibacteria group bacterium]|jgi:prolyl-tRNA editing enzyme YbaK/EbsC (Cys-tRNA(Pro) deacylase)|nr:YbaK/EbsC family protein [Patescibacteria group bacterium]